MGGFPVRYAWPVAEVRAAEDALLALVPPGALMQRAAAGLAVHSGRLLDRVYGARVALLVGAGDNGGDALYAGARLAARGARVSAVLLRPDRAHAGGLAALRRAGGRAGAAAGPAAVSLVRGADLVLDGIVGIGGSGGLRPDAAELAEAAGAAGLRVAVDLPSGVDADTGAVPGAAFSANLTVTFGCLKPGLLVGAGADRAGEVRLVDIGLGPYLPPATVRVLERADVAALLPRPGADSDKYTRGVVGVVAGSAQYTGAAVLSAGAAVHGGAGMVRYVGSAADAVRARWPEVVIAAGPPSEAGRVQAWVAGPGLGTDGAAAALLTDV
ncbi:MAG TPA: NAD(P)H-hydrate epimerase, partial [Mycobacteriales bacterium]|nr:NAD(P)H-hydrate epimerase [Mycobacteriales bacterium]